MADLYPKPFPPPWADAWGDDRFGLWAALLAGEVTQRMRYLPPGSFFMGSPPDEPERFDDEGPQHRVILTQGVWLADTACTQGLWLAVMGGDNPSESKGDLDLPVEQVSWDDVQGFLAKLQAHLPAGVEAVLPTEAQWEYACRASTTTPFSFGHHISTNQVNYNGKQPYNHGPQGEWRQETVPVKALAANAWGLHQMHGNVWECCADGKRNYTKEAITDPSGTLDGGSIAVRGGSWNNYAQLARSALRGRIERGGRRHSLGFRFALRSTSQSGAGGPL